MNDVRRAEDIVNKVLPMSAVLKRLYGVVVSGKQSIHCPFPTHGGPDKVKSARYFPDTNTVYCWAEQRLFRPVDALRLAGWDNFQIIQAASKLAPRVELSFEEPKELDLPDVLYKTSRRFASGNCKWLDVALVLQDFVDGEYLA